MVSPTILAAVRAVIDIGGFFVFAAVLAECEGAAVSAPRIPIAAAAHLPRLHVTRGMHKI